jgi:hypothetical protein
MRPSPGTYPAYFENYIPLVKQNSVMEAFDQNWKELNEFVSKIPIQKENYAYGPGKWTIKQVIHHLADTERIMTYRALRFARKDPQQPLPFEEDLYAANSELQNRDLKDIMAEFETIRKASVSLFRTFSGETLQRSGTTGGGNCTVLALGFMVCGHAVHHMNVIRERYL